MIYKIMIFQNIAERPLNITSTLSNFKSFIKQVYQKEWAQNINKKKRQNNYFRAENVQKKEKILTLKEEKANLLLIVGKIYFFKKFQFLEK